MMTSSNGNIFHVTGPLCGEFTGHRWIPLTKARCRALMFSLICPWINGWLNNHEAGDLRRHHAQYDVIVMNWLQSSVCNITWQQTCKMLQFDYFNGPCSNQFHFKIIRKVKIAESFILSHMPRDNFLMDEPVLFTETWLAIMMGGSKVTCCIQGYLMIYMETRDPLYKRFMSS